MSITGKLKRFLRDVRAYIQGNIRCWLYYNGYSYLIPWHIKDQIRIRINSMKRECFDSGSCIKCGCKTTALQFANKSCDGDCYPYMMSVRSFLNMLEGGIYLDKKTGIKWVLEEADIPRDLVEGFPSVFVKIKDKKDV